MKKIIVALIGILCLISCQTFETESDVSEVSFNINVLESHFITKAIDNNSVISLIKETLPDKYILRLKNLNNGNTYEFFSNETISVPNGTYNIENIADDNKYYFGGLGKLPGQKCDVNLGYSYHNGVGICKYPRIKIKDTIEIKGNNTFQLKGEIKCQCFVYDLEVVDKIIWAIYADLVNVECITKKNNIAIFYTWGTTDKGMDFQFRVVAKSGANVESCKYGIESNPNCDNGLPYGKYYILKPNYIENSNVNSNITINNFEYGGDLTPKP